MRKLLIRLVLVLVVVGAGYGAYSVYKSMPQRQLQIPMTKVRQGDVVVRSYTRGELRAVRSATLVAPNLFGTVQVTQLASLGSLAKEKDLIVEFDDAEVLSRLEEKQLELDQVDEQIKKSQADLAIRNNQDDVELLRARYSVRRAELEVKRNELLSTIEQQKNNLNLKEATQRLKQLESDVKSRREQAQAELAVLGERKRKAQMEMVRERQRLSQVKLLSPIGGLVAIRQNRGGMYFPGMQIPDIREGDQVQPGMMVADILDLSELEVVAKVGELDRASLKEGQDVLMRLDAMGEKTFHGKIKSMSGTASANIFSGDPAKKFDVVFSVDMKELLTGLGAKPEQIQKMLAQAEANRKKGPMPSMAMGGFGGGGAPGGGMMMVRAGGGAPGGGAPGGGGGMQGPPTMGGFAGGAPGAGAPGAGAAGAEGGREGRQGGGGRAGGFGAGMSDEDRTKMREAMQKALNGRQMQDLSPEERTKLFEEVRKAVPALATMQRPGGAAGTPGAAAGAPGAAGAAGAPGAGGERAGRGNRAPGGGGAPGAGGPPMMMPMMGGGGQFSEKELAEAKLPPPVDPNNQLDVLLRPGLLADVEIILEKFPNAVNIPNQAVFEKDGKPIVYVRNGNKWDERVIQPLKRSESVVVVASGVKAGETIAMSDPTETAGDKKKKQDKPAGGGAVGSLPGGGRS